MSWNRRANASPAQKPRARASQRMSVATPFEERDVDAVLEVVVDGVLDARPDRDAGDVSGVTVWASVLATSSLVRVFSPVMARNASSSTRKAAMNIFLA